MSNRGEELWSAYTSLGPCDFALDQISAKLPAKGFLEQFQVLSDEHPAIPQDGRPSHSSRLLFEQELAEVKTGNGHLPVTL